MQRALSAVAVVCVLVFSIAEADARGRSFSCGLKQRLYFNLPAKYNYSLAWADGSLPIVSFPSPGVVVVQRRKGKASDGKLPGGHVSRIVSVISECRATVTDEAGTYERDICKNLVAYVRP